ncbi:MAG: LD-carboxypeptidase [Betaproteobacteria bacterium]
MILAARRIGMVAPSGFLPDTAVLDRAAAFFAARGWEVQAGESCFASEQRFAGPDELRHADLFRFATDPSIDIVLAARGGYGFTRFMERVDFAKIKARASIIVGYSDFTAFHLAYLARGGVSFAGPSAADFGARTPAPFTIEHFFGVLENRDYAVDFESEGPTCAVSGRLWGGNLALVCALIGTRFMPKVTGGILFLEDVNEPAYKIERMMLQLDQAGILARQRAILLGAFDPLTPMPNDNGYSLPAALEFLRKRSKTPILTGLPFGHVTRKLTLPVGGRAKLTVRRGRAQLALSGYPVLAKRA